jgi:hypothetical protein
MTHIFILLYQSYHHIRKGMCVCVCVRARAVYRIFSNLPMEGFTEIRSVVSEIKLADRRRIWPPNYAFVLYISCAHLSYMNTMNSELMTFLCGPGCHSDTHAGSLLVIGDSVEWIAALSSSYTHIIHITYHRWGFSWFSSVISGKFWNLILN